VSIDKEPKGFVVFMGQKRLELSLIIIAIISTVYLLPATGTGDLENGFLLWLERAQDLGFVNSFNKIVTAYPPFYILVPYVISNLLGITFFLSYKIFLVLGLVFLVFVVFKVSRSFKLSLSVYLIAVIPTLGLGYGDIFLTAFLLLSISYLSKGNSIKSGLFFSISMCFKFTPLILLPVFFLVLLNKKGGLHFRNFSSFLCEVIRFLGALSTFPILICLIFSPFAYIENIKLALLNGYLSGHALNLGWLITAFGQIFGQDSARMLEPGIVRFTYVDVHSNLYLSMKYSALLLIAVYLLSRVNQELDFVAVLRICVNVVAVYYLLAPGVHENHLLFVAPFCLFLRSSIKYENFASLYILFVALINPVIFYGLDGNSFIPRLILHQDLTVVLSLVNVILFCVFYFSLLIKFDVINRKKIKVPRMDE
jgi:hypothetical protein